MQTKPDCDAIAQSNAQLELRQNSLEDQLLDLQNLLDSLYPTDPQRPDLEKKIAQMNQERTSLVDELHKGEVALRDCQQQRQQ